VGGKGAMAPSKFFENIVILCFERRFSKQNSVIRLKSNILAPKYFFGSPQIFGMAMPLVMLTKKVLERTQKFSHFKTASNSFRSKT